MYFWRINYSLPCCLPNAPNIFIILCRLVAKEVLLLDKIDDFKQYLSRGERLWPQHFLTEVKFESQVSRSPSWKDHMHLKLNWAVTRELHMIYDSLFLLSGSKPITNTGITDIVILMKIGIGYLILRCSHHKMLCIFKKTLDLLKIVSTRKLPTNGLR